MGRQKIDGTAVYHHGKGHHMWTYCLHLGPFTYGGTHYDLGILVNPKHRDHLSLAVVYGPEDHEYISGDAYFDFPDSEEFAEPRGIRAEVIKRYEAEIAGSGRFCIG